MAQEKPGSRTDRHGYQKKWQNENAAQQSRAGREIYPIETGGINWERRLAGKTSIEVFGNSYLPAVFDMALSEAHTVVIDKLEEVFRKGGQFAIAMPRGQGKTSWCLAAILWGILYGIRQFVVFVGAMDTQAKELLDDCRKFFFNSDEILCDFPEAAVPIRRLENRHHLAKGQLHRNRPTEITWGASEIRLASMAFDDGEADTYLEHDPEFLVKLPNGSYLPKSSGSIITSFGIGGSIRGTARTHPILLKKMRPDVTILDDVQKDQGAKSIAICDNLERIIDGTIKYLSGPTRRMASIMPCTIIAPDDVSSRYLSRVKKPTWRGVLTKMVTSWPEGLDDHSIDSETVAGAHWLKYKELYEQSFRTFEDDRLSRAYYVENRAEMIDGFKVSWPERLSDGDIDAQQTAMNLRFDNADTFASELQNNPRPFRTEDTTMISSRELAERTSGYKRGIVPPYADHIVAHIDIQHEILFWTVYAGGLDYTGSIIDYGTWPHIPRRYFQKAQLLKMMMLSRKFLEKYPGRVEKKAAPTGGHRAEFEPKIYFALRSCCDMLLGRKFERIDGHTMRIKALGIDIHWGKSSDTAKRFIAEYGNQEVYPMAGQYVGPEQKQYYEYNLTKGWKFEHQVHPALRECRWIYRREPTGYYYISVDVNMTKTFLHNRLSCHQGSRGAITIFQDEPEQHEMFCDHICNSEYPEPITARDRTKDIWKERASSPDNDFFDNTVGCMVLSSWCGARIQDDASGELAKQEMPKRRKLSDIWAEKRRNRQ